MGCQRWWQTQIRGLVQTNGLWQGRLRFRCWDQELASSDRVASKYFSAHLEFVWHASGRVSETKNEAIIFSYWSVLRDEACSYLLEILLTGGKTESWTVRTVHVFDTSEAGWQGPTCPAYPWHDPPIHETQGCGGRCWGQQICLQQPWAGGDGQGNSGSSSGKI